MCEEIKYRVFGVDFDTAEKAKKYGFECIRWLGKNSDQQLTEFKIFSACGNCRMVFETVKVN